MQEEGEVWKPIPGYPGHMASTMGRIKSIDHVSMRGNIQYSVKGKIRKCNINKFGYRKVQLIHRGTIFQAHRLIAITFLDNPHSLPAVNHINGDKSDNRVINLEWCSHKSNTSHALKSGLMKPPSGTKHWKSLLDEIQVKTIRKCLSDGMTAYKLAKYFKVNYLVVYNIKHNLSYTSI